jgi:hypothetical protein
MGSGPFRFVAHGIGQDINGERNPDYYHRELPYLDGFVGTFAEKQVVHVEAIYSGRAAMEFRGLPPSAIRTRIVDTEAREFPVLCWYRMVPERSYAMAGRGPSHYINRDLSDIWLDRAPNG